jgi:hypothetical protein
MGRGGFVNADLALEGGEEAAVTARDRRLRQAERRSRAWQWTLLVCTVLATLLPTALFQPQSRLLLLKLTVAGLLAFIPGWLYLQFIRFKGRSLYDEYVLNLFRLHIDEYRNLPAPPRHTSYYQLWDTHHKQLDAKTKDNLYRRKFEAVYGRHSVSTIELIEDRPGLRERTETFSPVLVATVLLCIGWALVVQPEAFREFDLLGKRPFSGRPSVPYEALVFGFIGAYWFILQDLIRRYFRDDLKTGAYISATARMIMVTLVVATVGLLPFGSSREQKILAFFIGIFPQIGVQVLKAGLSKAFGGVVPTIRTDHPLSDLDGLSIWDQARLLEEGIEDMENLVTANLVDVLLRSRVPVSRLVDWLDQAVLCLRLPGRTEGHAPRDRLRELGVRSATDLERVWASPLGGDPVFRREIGRALKVADDAGPTVVAAMLASFAGEVNLYHVREFKRHDWLQRDDRRARAEAAPRAA